MAGIITPEIIAEDRNRFQERLASVNYQPTTPEEIAANRTRTLRLVKLNPDQLSLEPILRDIGYEVKPRDYSFRERVAKLLKDPSSVVRNIGQQRWYSKTTRAMKAAG